MENLKGEIQRQQLNHGPACIGYYLNYRDVLRNKVYGYGRIRSIANEMRENMGK